MWDKLGGTTARDKPGDATARDKFGGTTARIRERQAGRDVSIPSFCR